MQAENDSSHDPLDAVLGFGDRSSVDADALRGAVLRQSVGVIRRRRRLKRCVLAAGLLICYLAGITTMGLWRTGAAGEPPTAAAKSMPVEPRQHPHALPRSAPKSAVSRESQIAAAIPTAFESWRNIGDYHLQHSGDISTAVASYSQAIDLATAEERAISPGQDNWLMMALKDARAKEKRHAYSEPN
jgi:cytochrome c-type biogenesis protein CcmH/NrfG